MIIITGNAHSQNETSLGRLQIFRRGTVRASVVISGKKLEQFMLHCNIVKHTAMKTNCRIHTNATQIKAAYSIINLK